MHNVRTAWEGILLLNTVELKKTWGNLSKLNAQPELTKQSYCMEFKQKNTSYKPL